MRKTTFKNYKWAVVVAQYGAIEWVKLFYSKKEAQKYIDALLFVYKEDDVLLWDRRECHDMVETAMKEEEPSFAIFCHYPKQSNSAWIPQYTLEEVI